MFCKHKVYNFSFCAKLYVDTQSLLLIMTNQKILKSLIISGIIIFSYVGLLFLLTEEGLTGSTTMIKDNGADLSGSVTLYDVKFDEIRINKHLINIEQE